MGEGVAYRMESVVGREAELGLIDAVLAQARDGLSGLVLDGDPGIGKTTLWREGIARATAHGYRVLACRAAPAEARLSFTALSDLLAPVEPATFEALPGPQHRALSAALLRADAAGAAPDPRAIGTGVVSVVSALATRAPVLLAVDDVQWLDRPSARAIDFALRRLDQHRVCVLATLRKGEPAGRSDLISALHGERIRRVGLGPLSLGALYSMIQQQLGLQLSRPVLLRIERATGGNPFYALEIARAVQAVGAENLQPGQPLPVSDDLRDLVAARLRGLPRRTRDALLEVSALAQPTVRVVDPSSLAPAEEAGVAHVCADGRIEFAHPLYAAAVYTAASHERRRRLHAELARHVPDVEERARHLTLSVDGADAAIAAVLEEAAEHAHRRGAPEVAAELAQQAAQRTPPDAVEARWERCLRAGWHFLKAGDPERARALAQEVLGASPPPPVRAQALHLLAKASMGDLAAGPLLQEALACVGDDPGHAALLEFALGTQLLAQLEPARANRHLVRAVELAESVGDAPLLAETLANKAVSDLLSGQGVDDAVLQRTLRLEDPERAAPFQLSPSFSVAQVYEFTGRIDEARELFALLRERLTARGQETDLPWVLVHLAGTSWLRGDLARAEAEADQALRGATLAGQEVFRAFALLVRSLVRATRGDRDRARTDGTEALAISERFGWAMGVSQSRYGLGFLALSEGDPLAAVAILEPVVTAIETVAVYEWPIAMALPDAIEAFVATGDLDRAERLTQALAALGRRFDRPWALATSGRCRALVDAAGGHLDRACAAAEQAIVDHRRLPMPFELGRTLLVLGQLQRRRGERRLARATLARALAIFEELGAALWADKARAELSRIGVRRAPEQLTEAERRVAELGARGLTNREIAAALFLSRRTVEANLARAYGKLGIRSRAELGRVMAERPS